MRLSTSVPAADEKKHGKKGEKGKGEKGRGKRISISVSP
jgi:hypothetical protein